MALKCKCGRTLYTQASARAHTCRFRTAAIAHRSNQRVYGGSGTTGPSFDTPMMPSSSDSGGFSGGGGDSGGGGASGSWD